MREEKKTCASISMTSRPKKNIPLMFEYRFVVIALFDVFKLLSFERVSNVLALNKVPYI
jgi:hypothetical protein